MPSDSGLWMTVVRIPRALASDAIRSTPEVSPPSLMMTHSRSLQVCEATLSRARASRMARFLVRVMTPTLG
jgi:hypothetical protein